VARGGAPLGSDAAVSPSVSKRVGRNDPPADDAGGGSSERSVSVVAACIITARRIGTVVCTENSIHVSESPNVGDDDRAILPLRGPVRLAVQVEEPT
jgi:hypothetical protein